jgi:hypothetical protein
MNASPIPPSEKHVDQILHTIHNKQFQPVYVHCVLGRDRIGLISCLYNRSVQDVFSRYLESRAVEGNETIRIPELVVCSWLENLFREAFYPPASDAVEKSPFLRLRESL